MVRDLRNIWATEKTKSRSPTPSTKLPTYTHVTSQPTRGDTFLGVLVQSGLADMGELIYCSLSHRGFYGRISHAETACQASLSITNSRSSLKLMSIELVMPPRNLILWRPLLLLPTIPPSIRVFSNESTLHDMASLQHQFYQ